VIVEGSSGQGPGAQGPGYRLPLALDWGTLTLRPLQVTGCEQGERLDRYPLHAGEGVLADRGSNPPETLLRLSAQAVLVMIRLNPGALPLYPRPGQRWDRGEHLQGVSEDYHGLPGGLGTPGRACEGGYTPIGWRRPRPAARRRCRQHARGRTPRQRTRFRAGWVWVFTTGPAEAIGRQSVIALYADARPAACRRPSL
jgi:hypothetical protein